MTMKFVSSLDIYVTKVEDLRGFINEDIYECVESLINEDDDGYESKFYDLKEEFECYELQLDEKRSAIIESVRALEKDIEELNSLQEYINDSKRLNRDKINKAIRKLDLDSTIKCLNNSL